MWGRVVKIAFSLPVLIVAGLYALYLVFGFFLVDPLAHKLLPWVGENKLASQLSAQRVSFNPFTLEATVDDLRLAEQDGKPLAGFDRLYVNLETTGLFRWALRIQDIQLDGPDVNLAVLPGGKLNWAALIARLNEDKEPPSDSIVRMLIEHIRIDDGHVEYTDANRPGKPFKAVLKPLGIELDGLSTLPEDRGDYLIAAKLPEQGGTLKWKGEVGLNPVVSTGEVQLEGMKLDRLIRVVKQAELAIKPTQGDIQAGLAYHFAIVDDKPQAVLARIQLALDNFAAAPAQGSGTLAIGHADLSLPRLDFSMQSGTQVKFSGLAIGLRDVRLAIDESPLFKLPQADINGVDFDLLAGRARVARVALTGGEVSVTRFADGSYDLTNAWKPVAGTAAEARAQSSAAAGKPFAFEVAAVHLQNWRAQELDRSFEQPMRLEVGNLDMRLALSNLDGPLQITEFNSEISALKLTSALQAEPAATLAKLQVSGGEFDLDAHAVSMQAVVLSGLRTRVERRDGQPLNWQAMLKQVRVASPASERAVVKLAAGAERDWTLALQRLALEDAAVHVEDSGKGAPVLLDIEQGSIEARKLSLDMARAIPLKLAFRVRQGGRFNASGSVVPGKPSGKLDLRLEGLSLKPFAPYVNQFARLYLRSGEASTRGKLVFAQAKSDMKLDFEGGFVVDDLAITEEETEEAFLGWKQLSSDSLTLSLAPDRVHIDELVALNPFGKVIIFEDKSINLRRILRTPATDKPATAAAAETRPAEETDVFPLDIARLRIVDANAEFADLSLPQQFGTRMHGLSGVVTGLATNPASTAQVELDGKVDDFGSARVRGSIQPFRATDFTDLTLTFRNLEMTRLTPYSGKFAGRKIDSGRLSVDLEYKIKQRQLAGENKFVINKLKLGEKVDSPDAMKLPLDLAIALLEDSNGIIDLDLPISGSLDDPQFSYGKIIWKAIVNVLTKLVTAPFRALGKLLGVSSEKLEAVSFDPGSSLLLPPEQEKLKMLSEAMAKRPALTLTLEPGYDPVADRRALQVQAMRREVAAGTGLKLAPNAEPGPVDVNNYEVQTWLEDRYTERVGKAEYQKLRASYKEKQAGGTNPITDSAFVERLGRSFKTRDTGPVSAFHTELLEQLTQKTLIDDAVLVKLAQARGQAMREDLVRNGLDGGRVSVGAPVELAAKDNQVGSKMSLGAGKAMVSTPSTAPAAVVP
ncbi:MAG: DUF748 domain-containing protein [Thiobacillus sp.]|nr:DUF748 domain-containing protein [Thiobacillus sp.]